MTDTNPPETGDQNTSLGRFRDAVRTRLLAVTEPPISTIAKIDELATGIADDAVLHLWAGRGDTGDTEVVPPPHPSVTSPDDRADVLAQLEEIRAAAMKAGGDVELREAQSHAFQVALEAVTTKASLLGLFPVLNSYEGRPAPDASWVTRD